MASGLKTRRAIAIERSAIMAGIGIFFLLWGALIRWQVHGSPWAKTTADARARAERDEEIERLDELRADLKRRMEALSPEEQALARETLETTRVRYVVLTNPVVQKLAALPRRPPAAPADSEESIRRIAVAWERTARALDALIWTAFLALCGWTIAGATLSRRRWLERAGELTILGCDGWLLFVGALGVALFGFTLEQPWTRLPTSFYLVPALALTVGVLLELGRIDARPLAERIALAWAAPAAGGAMTLALAGLFRLLGY